MGFAKLTCNYDSDNDMSVYDSPDKIANQISLYAARGTLIESEGPSWFYGTGSEHTVLYQYQLYGAKDVSNLPIPILLAQVQDIHIVCFRSISATFKVRRLTTNQSQSPHFHSTWVRSFLETLPLTIAPPKVARRLGVLG